MKCMAAAACAAITFASAWADAGFSAGRWNITFQPDGEGVSLLVYHRTAFAPRTDRMAQLEHILRPGRLEGES